MTRKIVLATHNPGKLVEIQALLAPLGVDLVSAGALGLPEPEETAPDFLGNARLKALASATGAGLPALADDSGFCVAALGGAPGVFSARWAGPQKDFAGAMARVNDGIGAADDRRAWFVCVLCLAEPDGGTRSFMGRVDGQVIWPPRGDRGFGYDPIFIPAGGTLTYGEMDPDVKHATSHRARAMAQLLRDGGLDPMSAALGFIGFGIMGERMLRAALAHDAAILRPVAVWDPSPEAASRLAVIAPGVPMLADADAVVAASDCVYIASPPASHLVHAAAAFAAGRAVFLEKPLSADTAAATAFVAKAETASVRAAVNFPMASSLAVTQLAEWQPQIGGLRSLSIECFFATWPRGWQHGASSWLDRPEQGGFTREVVSHFLFLTRRRLGPLVLQQARARFDAPGRAETAIAARLTAGGVPVELAGGVGVTLKDDHNRWTLEGAEGAIRLCDWSIAERRTPDGSWAPAPGAMANELARPLNLRRQLDKVAAMTRGDQHDLATLREALDVQLVVEAILMG